MNTIENNIDPVRRRRGEPRTPLERARIAEGTRRALAARKRRLEAQAEAARLRPVELTLFEEQNVVTERARPLALLAGEEVRAPRLDTGTRARS
jgi:hypothetical protein